MKKCPYCGEMIQDEAKKCRYCGEWLEEHEKTPVGENTPTQTNSNNKFLKNKLSSKKWRIALGIVGVVVVLLIIRYVVYTLTYPSKVEEYKTNVTKAYYLALVTNDNFRSIWSDVIFNDKNYFSNIDGKMHEYSYSDDNTDLEPCKDFNEAIENRKSMNSISGLNSFLDSLQIIAKNNLKSITPAPFGYNEKYEPLKSMYHDLEILIRNAKSPEGNIQTYSQNISSTSSDFEKNLSQSNIDFKSIEDSLDSYKLTSIMEFGLFTGLYKVRLADAKEKQSQANYDANKKQFQANYNAGVKFLTANKKKPGVVTSPSGLQYKIIKKGTGAIAKENDEVVVNYEGKTIDGKVFDSSYSRGQSVTFRPNQVIAGLTEALTHMPAGSVWEIYVPYELGYGSEGSGPILPFSVLIFKVEILNVKRN